MLARALSDVSRGGGGEDSLTGQQRRKRELGPSPDRSMDLSASAAGSKRARGDERPAMAPGLEQLFRATKIAKPKLYWLPLSEEAVAAKRARRKELRKEAKERKAGGDADAAVGGGKKKRGRSYSRSRSRLRSRSRSPPRRR